MVPSAPERFSPSKGDGAVHGLARAGDGARHGPSIGTVAARLRDGLRRSRTSLAEFAYDVLRATIREGGFAPGEHLREIDIAEQLGISRTPVREAFRRLISDGLLVPGPWNGVKLVELSQQEVVELYAVRESLEGTAAALAAQHATDAERQLLAAIIERERNTDDLERQIRINAELHQAIYAAAHNRYLLRSLGSISDVLGLLRYSSFLVTGSAAAAHAEHVAMVEAVASRDPEAAEAATRKHIRAALNWRLRLMSHELSRSEVQQASLSQ